MLITPIHDHLDSGKELIMSESVRELSRDARRALREGTAGIRRRQRDRLAAAVAFARAESPFYRRLYRGLPERVDDPTLLPVTDKKLLMENFDDVVTDRAVTKAKVEAFVADPGLVGQRFESTDYLVATSSGTSGVRGLYLIDQRYTDVHVSLGSRASGLIGLRDGLRVLLRGGRTAIVSAPGGHFFTVASAERFRLDHSRFGRMMRVFSINQPLPQLVAELNDYSPGIIAGFLSMITVLAGEQEAGRLRLRPGMIIPGGETITDEVRERLEAAFGAGVRPAYAATECGFLSLYCKEHWYHVNADWAVLEPVDADHRPVPPGEPSHTVLLSNLANRVQPFLRYDLGDSVLVRPDPCHCGNPLPAIRVQGRAADLLAFPRDDGDIAELSPMLFGTLLDGVSGVDRYQLVQTAPATLRVRLQPRPDAEPDQVWRSVRDALDRLLAEHRISGVAVQRSEEAPEQSPGGKFRRIIPLAPTPHLR